MLTQSEIALGFPNQAWIDMLAEAQNLRALDIKAPRARDLRPLANLDLFHLTLSYPSFVKDWSFIGAMPSLLRLALDYHAFSCQPGPGQATFPTRSLAVERCLEKFATPVTRTTSWPQAVASRFIGVSAV
jgi:hypothetical protein